MEVGLDFEAFYTAQYQRVFKAIYLTSGDTDLAHDLTQEAFQRAFVRWRRLSRHDWAGGWVMTTALNLLRKQRGTPRELPLDQVKDDVQIDTNEREMDLLRAIRALPHRQRTAVLLHYLADLPVRSAADAMDVAEGTIKALLSQARANLARKLGDG